MLYYLISLRTIHSTLPYLWWCSIFGDNQHWNVRNTLPYVIKLTFYGSDLKINMWRKQKKFECKKSKNTWPFLARVLMQHNIIMDVGCNNWARLQINVNISRFFRHITRCVSRAASLLGYGSVIFTWLLITWRASGHWLFNFFTLKFEWLLQIDVVGLRYRRQPLQHTVYRQAILGVHC